VRVSEREIKVVPVARVAAIRSDVRIEPVAPQGGGLGQGRHADWLVLKAAGVRCRWWSIPPARDRICIGMAAGLDITLDLLARTENEAAVSVLLSALESPVPAIRLGALRALLERRSPLGQREVVRRLHTMDEAWKSVLLQYRGRMTRALRDALLGDEPQVRTNACHGVLLFKEYDLIPTLLSALPAADPPTADLLSRTMLELVELLYHDVTRPRDYTERRDPQLMRRHVVASLEKSVQRYAEHKRREAVEAFLMLADRDNPLLHQVLGDPLHAAYLVTTQVLTHSQRPGVLRLLLEWLEDRRAPSAALTVAAHRCDLPFLRAALALLQRGLNPALEHNLHRMEHVAWATAPYHILDALSDAEQAAAIAWLMASSAPRAQVFQALCYLAQRGKPRGRVAAVEALGSFSGAEANQRMLQLAHDPDPSVQAAALRQLRRRGIPSALAVLLQHLGSPHEPVRQAVRECLTEFRIQRFLASFDLLDDEVRQSTGPLVKHIDPDALPKLREELQSPSRTRRLRALEAAAAMRAVADLQAEVIELLHDSDGMIRSCAAAALGTCPTPEAQHALRHALGDSSTMVREAAQRSLAAHAEAVPAQAHWASAPGPASD
jgi:HEAT repeat protein